MRYISILVVFLFTGCASNYYDLKNTTSVSSPENYEVVAKKIYTAAKQCWVKDSTLLLQGVVVGSDVTLDGIVIYAGHSHSKDYIESIAIKFVVEENGDGAVINLYERSSFSFEKTDFSVAHDWLQGNYVCTKESV